MQCVYAYFSFFAYHKNHFHSIDNDLQKQQSIAKPFSILFIFFPYIFMCLSLYIYKYYICLFRFSFESFSFIASRYGCFSVFSNSLQYSLSLLCLTLSHLCPIFRMFDYSQYTKGTHNESTKYRILNIVFGFWPTSNIIKQYDHLWMTIC